MREQPSISNPLLPQPSSTARTPSWFRFRGFVVALDSVNTLDEAVNVGISFALGVTQLSWGAVHLLLPGEDCLGLCSAQGASGIPGALAQRPFDAAPLDAVLAGDPLFAEGRAEVVRILGPATPDDPIGSLALLPLMAHDRPVGLLSLGATTRGGDLSPTTRNLLEAIAIQLGQALERLQSQSALTLSERQIKQVFDHLSSGLLVTSREHATVLLANEEARRLLGLPANCVGRALGELLPGGERLLQPPNATSRHLELALQNGERRLLGYTNMSLAMRNGLAIVTLFRDIRPILVAESRRRRAEQLAQVGDMVARLSHEIKNPLATILAGVQFLQRQCDDANERQGIVLDGVLEGVRALSGTVEQLLDASRPINMQPRALGLSELLRQSVQPHYELASGRSISLELFQRADDARVAVDPRLFTRVLNNLVINAIEALEQGGNLRVGWRRLQREEQSEKFPGYAGEVALIAVEDDGPGMPREVLEQAFRPFFTTKTKGTGLGLSVAAEIVEAHGGVLVVDSTVGKGTLFRIYLPTDTTPCPAFADGSDCSSCSRGDSICPADCPVRRQSSGYCCWRIVSESQGHPTEWPSQCRECEVFRIGNLLPYHRSNAADRDR